MAAAFLVTGADSVAVLDVRPRQGRVAQRVAERLAAKLCLADAETASGAWAACHRAAQVRGLCRRCYERFLAAVAELPKSKRAAFIAEEVRSGRVLLPARGRWGANAYRDRARRMEQAKE